MDINSNINSKYAKKLARQNKKKERDAKKAWNEEKNKLSTPITRRITNFITLKRVLLIFVAVIAGIWLLGIIMPKIIESTLNSKPVYYVKDNNLFLNKRRNRNVSNNTIFQSNYLNSTGNIVNNLTKISKVKNKIYQNNNKIIYADSIDIENNKCNLVVTNTDTSKDIVRIENVNYNEYKSSKNIDSLLYIKKEGNENNLYTNNLNKEILISNNVDKFYSDEDLNVIYYTSNDDLYVYVNDKSDIQNFNNTRLLATKSFILEDSNTELSYQQILDSNGFTNLYVVKNKLNNVVDIYKINNIKSKNINDISIDLLFDEVTNIGPYYHNENIMYIFKYGTKQLNIRDFIIDDISDGSFYDTEPKPENYNNDPFGGFGSFFDDPFGSFFGNPFGGLGGLFNSGNYQYNNDKNLYDAIKKYIEENKDKIEEYKNQIENDTFDKEIKKMYYYDGSQLKDFTDEQVSTIRIINGNRPYFFVESFTLDKNNIEKVKLSDIIASNLTVIDYMKQVNIENKTMKYIFYKETGMKINGLPDSGEFSIYLGKDKFIIDHIVGNNHNIYSVPKDFGNVVDAKVEDENVNTTNLKILTSPYISDVVYVVKSNNNSVLYFNDQELTTPVESDYVCVSNDLKQIIYFTDINKNKNTATLNILKDGDFNTSVVTNVFMPSVSTNAVDSSIYFIADFDGNKPYGNLFSLNKYGKKVKLADKINSILNVNIDDEKNNIYNKKENNNYKKTEIGIDFGENGAETF